MMYFIYHAKFEDGTAAQTAPTHKPYGYAARSARGLVKWTRTEAAAERAAGKLGAVAAAEREETDAYRRALEARPLPTPPVRATHGCDRTHRTYAAFARCSWPRAFSVWGEGPYAAVVVENHHYANGQRAYWPRIYLYETLKEAADTVNRNSTDYFIRKVREVRLVRLIEPELADYEDKRLHHNQMKDQDD